MNSFGEVISRSPENLEASFDELAERVLPLSDCNIIGKISAKTANESYDRLTYRLETPRLAFTLNGRPVAVKIAVFREDHLYPGTSSAVEPPAYREIQLSFVGQTASGEKSTIDQRRQVYLREGLDANTIIQLQEMVGQFEATARALSPDEAEARGFSPAAIQFLAKTG